MKGAGGIAGESRVPVYKQRPVYRQNEFCLDTNFRLGYRQNEFCRYTNKARLRGLYIYRGQWALGIVGEGLPVQWDEVASGVGGGKMKGALLVYNNKSVAAKELWEKEESPISGMR
jgi:hypothetical protein